jgi:hypothetical protein
MRAGLLAALCACAVAAKVGPIQAETLAITQDAYANTLDPDDNKAARAVLQVGRWSDNRAFLQFDLAALGQQAVLSATLVLPVVNTGSDTSGVVEVRVIQDAWSEDTVTFNTQPALSPPRASVTVDLAQIGDTIHIDITDIVRRWADESIPAHGLALTSPDLDAFGVRLDTDSAEIHVRLADWESYASAPVQLSWRAPTTRSDGTPLSVGEIDSYILLMNGSVLSDAIPGDAVTATVDIFLPGEFCFRLATRDLSQRVGPLSPAACWLVHPAAGG